MNLIKGKKFISRNKFDIPLQISCIFKNIRENHNYIIVVLWLVSRINIFKTIAYFLNIYFLLIQILLQFKYIANSAFLISLDSAPGGNVGMAITQVIGLIGMCQWGMRQTAELENQMTSTERVLEYTKLQPEPSLETPSSTKLPHGWPKTGRLEFKNVSLRYIIFLTK